MRGTNFQADRSSSIARVYFALWPEQIAVTAMQTLARKMQRNCGGRVMRPETLHLTLLFLGDVPRLRLQDLLDAASNVHAVPFQLVLEKFSCWQHNHIAYLAPMGLPGELQALAAALRQAVADAGFSFDRRTFAAHVTLLRNISNMFPSWSVVPVVWDVRQFVLVESVPDGARRRYQILGSWPLS